jgi:hypothetical protein
MASLASHTSYTAQPDWKDPAWFSVACDALEQAKCLQIEYESFARIVEVHRVGVSPCGDHILSGWQIRGRDGERAGWKLLNLEEPISLTLTDIPSLAPRPDYRRGAKQFIGIICQL